MKKFLSFIVLLAISGTLSFGQTVNVKPTTIRQFQEGEYQGLEQYFNKNVVTNSKATIWLSNMATASQWVAAKLSDQSANITNTWQWIADTNSFSSTWVSYMGKGVRSNTPAQGLFYFDAITNLAGSNYGISNSTLTNAVAINTTGKMAVSIKFYQMYAAFNQDSTLLEISSDGSNWHSIDVNPTVAVNTLTRGWKEINITPWAANKTNLWVRFRFYAPATVSGNPAYSGGYGWALDDVEVFEPANNNIIVDRATMYDGYTEIPNGIGRPMYYDADFTNLGAKTQTHLKLHGVELTTHADSISIDTTINPGTSITGWSIYNYLFFPMNHTIGTYKVFSYISTDSLPFVLAQDTFDIKIVCDTCKYSRDNNTYVGSRWAETTGTTCDPYTAVNRTLVNADRMMYGVNCVVNIATKVNSKIRAVLYKYFAGSASRTIVAQSNNYYITADKIPTTAPMVNPPAINLAFTNGYTLQKDSTYWIGIQVYGGTDTVKMALDNTGIPQYEQTSLYFDPTANMWYLWAPGNVPAVMIRGVFNQNFHWDAVGINEVQNSVSLFSCMPNPANTFTQIAYELKKNENVNIIITDITGRVVKNINQGMQTKGNYTLDIDVTSLTSGTYFYTLKTPTAKATDKLIVVRR
ncbi:MAG: T9SS type A sorting domain-containing protein [Bacteroidetes bacterium]|nr:T9SS type A sorting domain-containing protein [Bacteroidota bacterium]